MMSLYPPLEAYRRDVGRLGDQGTFGADDGQWVAASLLLQRYVEAAPADRHSLGAQLARYLAFDEELTVSNAGLSLGAEIEAAGALNLAAAWLHLLERIVPEGRVLELGRVRGQRATVALKLGATDAALELYTDVERLGESSAEPELTARAWIGFALLAHMRGNYPEARRWYQAAALVADDNECSQQSCYAHQGLLICAGVARDFDRAMVEGWQAFLSSQRIPDREAEVLNNIAQALQDSGNHRVALRGFAAAAARGKSVHLLLGAIGGVAVAGAALGRSGVVAAAASRVKHLAANAWSYPVAMALLDLSDAYGLLGQTAAADEYRAQARALAVKHSYHELIHRANERKTQIPDHQTLVRLGSAAQQVVGDIESLYAPPDLCAVN